MVGIRCWILLVLSVFALQANAQFNQPLKHSQSIRLATQYGFIIPHRPTMRHLIIDHVPSFELSYQKEVSGEELWHALFLHPGYGVTLYHVDLGNPDVLGRGTGIYPYVSLPLAQSSKWSYQVKVGMGLVFLNSPFDLEDNPKNIAIGSKINSLFIFQNEFEYLFSERLSLSTGLSFTHYSNASVRVPNLGLNIPSLRFSVNYHFGEESSSRIHQGKDHSNDFTSVTSLFIMGNGGLKEAYPAGGQKFGAFTLSAMVRKSLSWKSVLYVGVEGFQNRSLLYQSEVANEPLENYWQISQLGLHANYTLKLGKLEMYVGPGIYALSRWKGDGLWYNKLGIRYWASGKWMLMTSLKTHNTKADYFEVGIGYHLWNSFTSRN